ncbi:MAG TPA: DUF1990 family protein [Rubricoccaceae bacterium]|nr:DUF1990 family protein [Rubricoccaceae bacterium]
MPRLRTDWERHRARLDALREAKPNYDLAQHHAFTRERGWNHDAYEAELPPEPPGPPLPRGAWAIARQLVHDYAFPDPRLITGVFVPDTPLEGRPMLLRARFLFFTFWFGVRVNSVIDEERGEGDERARVWGYSYTTLEGHFEQGQITFEVWKYVATGRVVFRVHAFSKPGRIRNPFYRIGFRLFGRGLQRRFARQAQARMQQFVREELEALRKAEPAPERETVDVQPAAAEPKAEQKLGAMNQGP